MSEPWEDFKQSNVATAEAGPWTEFKSESPGPWEDFQETTTATTSPPHESLTADATMAAFREQSSAQIMSERMASPTQSQKLSAQQADIAAEQTPAASKLASKVASGLEKGMAMPERAIRGALDFLGFYGALDATLGTGTRYQDYNRGWLEHFNKREQRLTNEDADLGATGFGYDAAEGVARAVTELPTQLFGGAAGAVRGAAVKGAAITAGAIGALSQYAQDRGAGKDKTESAIYGGVSGAITGLTTAAFGATGVESIFKNEGVRGVGIRILNVLKQAGLEGAEESVDQFQQDLLERTARNPNKPIGDSVREVLLAGSIGTLIGGAASSLAELGGGGMKPEQAALVAADAPLTGAAIEGINLPELNASLRAPPAEVVEVSLTPATDAASAQSLPSSATKETVAAEPSTNTPVSEGQVPPSPVNPSELMPALMVNGKPITGFGSHAEISNAGNSDVKLAFLDDSAHVFVDKAGKVFSRYEAATALNEPIDPETGKPTPLQSDRLRSLQDAAPEPVREETESAGDTMTGLGAASEGEVEPSGTALKNAVGELERVTQGLPEPFDKQTRKMAPVWVEAGDVLAKDPQAGEKLAAELKINPERGMTDTDSALLLRHKVALENRKNQAAEDSITAVTPEAKAEAQARFDDLSNQLLDLLDAAKFRGSQWGREGRWRQAIAFEDFSLENMRREARMKKDGDLTYEEEAWVKKRQEELVEKQKIEADLEREAERQNQTTDVEESVSETVKTARARQKKDKSNAAERDLEAEHKDAVDHLKETFIENGDISGESTTIRKLMELIVEREGVTERLKMEDRVHEILSKEVDPTITRQQAMDLMSNYGKSRLPSPEFAKRTVRDIVAQILSVRKLLDYFQGERPKLTGQLRDAPSDIQRGLIKMVNEAKKAFKLDGPTDNARAIKSALDAINTRLKNRIADLKQEIATRQKIIRQRQPSPYNDETLRMRAELAELQKTHAEIFPKTGLTGAQRLELLEKSADRQIAELERQLKSGEIFPKSKIPFKGESEKLTAARSRLEELKATREFARESAQPNLEPEAKFLLNYLLRLRQREADYLARLSKGDFAKRVKPKRELSKDVLDAKAKVEAAKQEFHKGLMEFEMARRSKLRKVWDGIKQTKNAFVNITSSYDLSAPRQMFLALLANSTRVLISPAKGVKLIAVPLGRMFQALSSESRSQRLEQWRKNRPNSTSGADKIAEIQYTELHSTDFTKWEENAHSVLDEWAQLPIRTGNAAKTVATAPFKVAAKGVRASNRAFITALNTARATLFDHLLETNFKDRAPTEADLKVIGNLVNVSTGRGKLSRGVAKATGEFLWSPSLLASRVQALIGQPLWGGGPLAGSGRARLVVAKEYTRWIVSGTALLAISGMFDDSDEDEPTSSDAGKIVRGNTRIDVWAGFQQPVVLGARLATGTTTSSTTGKTKDISGYGTGEVIWNFFKNKARPDIAAIVKVAIAAIDSGKDAKDVRITPAEAATGIIPIPLAVHDVIAVMRDRGMEEGAIIQALSLFGVGVNTYEDKEAQK